MVTQRIIGTEQVPIIGTEKIMIKDSKCTTTKSHQTAKENSKKVSKKQWIYKTEKNFLMANKSLPINN